MADARVRTLKTPQQPMILAVACGPRVRDYCRDAGLEVGAGVRACGVDAITTEAAALHPLVIVVPEELYWFDRKELDALAIDVRARIVPVQGEQMAYDELRVLVISALKSAQRMRKA